MHHRWLLLGAVLVSCLVASHAQFLEFLGGLALLKGVALAGYVLGSHKGGGYRRSYRGGYNRGWRRHRRAVGTAATEEEDALLASVTQLDPNGCLLKLLCLTRATPEEERSSHQALLLHLFGDISSAPTHASEPFAQALQTGGSAQRHAAACRDHYLRCPLSGSALHGMLVMAWTAHHHTPPTPSG
ncbi:uncharacterized protein LOC123501625 [Portunus trituberculatus]|uniref:uncharacterized protein LOC123501625 n=1 Tax=Portunus trituberculatus TaxID=210409 RepID=UPI001E1CCF35|nr:uncharacterized protein LOC123501625 [Portunus trituberculatus]